MKRPYFLGIDVGTYETKGVIVAEDGVVVQSDRIRHGLSILHPGWAEHDAEAVWWHDTCTLIRKLLDSAAIFPGQIQAIACSAIAPCVLPLGEDGRALRPAILYGIDTRASAEIAELESEIGRDTLIERCGNTLSTQSVGPKILWLKRHEPEVYSQARHFVTATTFLVGRLTNRLWVDHYTAAAGYTPFYNVSTQGWDLELCREIVDIEQLPQIGWAADTAGTITPEAARATGLAEGTPVIVGTADAAAEAVSVGVVDPGQTMLMYGSTAFMICVTSEHIKDQRLWSAPFLFPQMFTLSGGMATTGALTQWFNDQIARDLATHDKSVAYSRLIEEGQRIPPGAQGLLVLPYFSGERTPIQDPHARGVLFGLTLSHSRSHVYRAMLEGIGHGIRHHLDIVAEVHVPQEELVAVGGGTHNSLWLQIVSDICGIPQRVPHQTIGASYGDAFLAGMGCGRFETKEAIRGWVREQRTILPNMEHRERYDAYHHLYLGLYEKTKEIMHQLHSL